MQVDDVGDLVATGQRAQHRHHRVMPEPPVMNSTDAGAGSGITKLPCGAASRTIVPGATPPTRWVDRNPSGMALTVMVMVRGEPRSGGHRARGQRIRPPPPASVDQQADPDVLAGLVVEGKAPARLDDQRRGVDGLAAHLQHPTTQLTRRPQRVGELK